MAETTYAIAQDLKEARAMIESLTTYVRGEQLYGTVGTGGFFSGGRMPALTVGALVMRLRRLRALAEAGKLDDSQRQHLADVEDKNKAVRREWTYHYDGKMRREVNSRLDAMKPFFEECASSMKLCARVYGPEVLRRTTVEELLIYMEGLGLDVSAERTKARGIDGQLRRYVTTTEFVWASDLESIYDRQKFWWMYAAPQEDDK
jgi:hypothetical protein